MAFKAPTTRRVQGSAVSGDVDQGVVLMDCDGGARVLRLVSGDNRRPPAGRKTVASAAPCSVTRPESVSNFNVSPLSSHQAGVVQGSASHPLHPGQDMSGDTDKRKMEQSRDLGSGYTPSIWSEPTPSSVVSMGMGHASDNLAGGMTMPSAGHSTGFNPSVWTSPTDDIQGQKGFPGLMSQILESGSQSNSKIKNSPQDVSASYQKAASNASLAVGTRVKHEVPTKCSSLTDEFGTVTMYPFGNYNAAVGEPHGAGDKLTTTIKKEKDVTDSFVQVNAVIPEGNGSHNNHEVEKKVSDNFPNMCALCGARYRTKGGLHSHTIYKHSDMRPYICELCGATFKVHSKLTRHNVEKHCDERPYICLMCGVSFKRKDKLGRHKRTIHSGDRPFVCRTCGKAFKRREVLRHHESKHFNGDRLPYQCDECGKRYGRTDKLKRHKKKEHGAKPTKDVEIRNNELSSL